MARPWQFRRFVAGSALGVFVGATVALLLSPEKRQAAETLLHERWQRAQQVAKQEGARTEEELWARFRQLVGLSSPDGLSSDVKNLLQ